MDFSNFLEDVSGHVRTTDLLPWVIQKAEDDRTYTGAYTNNTYALDFANINRENKREIQLRVTTTAGSSYYAVEPWSARTDIIPGARIFIGPFNDIETANPAKVAYIETFADKTYLGDLYGKGFNFTLDLTIYAQSQNECKELMDLLNMFFTFLIPQRFHNGYGVVLKTISNSNLVEKDGEMGEEAFKATFSIGAWTESQVFVPRNTIGSYTLWLEMREQINGLITQGS